MAGRIKLHTRVLAIVLGMCWLLVGAFMIFQYQREKEFKSQLLDTRLQMYNTHILEGMRRGDSISAIISRATAPVKELRVTLIDTKGNVVYDNNDRTPFPMANHNNRPEVKAARAKGSGYMVERHSESDDMDYFYSAALKGDDGMVIRSAAPYTHSLQEFLKADSSLLWIMAAITIVMSLLGYLATRKISTSISRLTRFAEKAEKGERIFDDQAFPDDELGSIAGHIVRLYVQRDQQHREAMRQQQDKIRIKKQLTNNINHELKTPVASIITCLELLEDHPELPDTRKEEFHRRILSNARRLKTLLADISTITRMDEGDALIGKEPVDLTALVNDVAADERMHTDMDINVTVPPLMITGNRQLLESIFRNLIDNAIAYSGATGISISADTGGNFTIRDNGCGIPPEHLPHIFERFYRIDKGRSRQAGGTGLGLAIVRNAVSVHGGTIKASNDHGLRFDFNLR